MLFSDSLLFPHFIIVHIVKDGKIFHSYSLDLFFRLSFITNRINWNRFVSSTWIKAKAKMRQLKVLLINFYHWMESIHFWWPHFAWVGSYRRVAGHLLGNDENVVVIRHFPRVQSTWFFPCSAKCTDQSTERENRYLTVSRSACHRD